MKKSLLLIALALLSLSVLGQEQEQPPVQPAEQPEVQAAEPAPVPPALPEGRDLRIVRFPEGFIHAGKEYPAGNYRLVLGEKDGQPVFFVANAAKELLFEDLAVVKQRNGGAGSGFQLSRGLMRDKEYFRIKVVTAGQWLMGYFLVKK